MTTVAEITSTGCSGVDLAQLARACADRRGIVVVTPRSGDHASPESLAWLASSASSGAVISPSHDAIAMRADRAWAVLAKLGQTPTVSEIASALREEDLPVVTDNSWLAHHLRMGQATEDPAASLRSEQDVASRLLVVVTSLGSRGSWSDDRATERIMRGILDWVEPSSITLLALDAPIGSDSARRLRSLGVSVETGPGDPRAWSAGLGHGFAAVVVTCSAVQAGAQAWVSEAFPDAVRAAWIDYLPWRRTERLRPTMPADEMAGLEWETAVGREAFVARLEAFDEVWFERADDYGRLAGALPRHRTRQLVAGMPDSGLQPALDGRDGIVVLSMSGHDVLSGDEDAATHFIEDLLPEIRDRAPGSNATVVADTPSPHLREAAKSAGVLIAPSAELDSILREARVLVSAHRHGDGGGPAVLAAMGSGTPFAALAAGVGGLPLDPVAGFALAGNGNDLVSRVSMLLESDHHWRRVRAHLDATVASLYSLAECRSRYGAALAGLGLAISANRGILRDSDPDRTGIATRAASPTRTLPTVPPLRPGAPRHLPAPPSVPADADGRYQLWRERHGPIPEVLASLHADLANLSYRPLISVVMPAMNTPVEWLQQAVDSLCGQIYPNWELCIGDDASTDAHTVALLDRLRRDGKAKVVHLESPGGISAASNAAIGIASGEYLAFMDHDDRLAPHALAQVVRWLNADPSLDVVYSDEDKEMPDGRLAEPHLKPDWSPDQLMSQNYISHVTVARASLVGEIGGLRSEYDGSQDYDLLLRLTEKTERVGHIPEPLYSWRVSEGSAASSRTAKPWAVDAAQRAVTDAVVRRYGAGAADHGVLPGILRPRYPIPGQPRVGIVIPTKDGRALLERCVSSILEKSTYRNFEILIVDNQTSDPETIEYLDRIPAKVVRYPHTFNYARMMNLAVDSISCDVLLFLNNDTEVRSPDWIEAMLEHAMRPEVGAVGARLYFGDGRLQHEGILVGVYMGWAANIDHGGLYMRGDIIRNVSAVTGACTMMRPSVYWRVGGNDERLRVAYNDVDICLRIRQAGYQIVYTPYAELTHYEGASRSGYEHHTDGPLFGEKWRPRQEIDPYFSPLFEREQPFQIAL